MARSSFARSKPPRPLRLVQAAADNPPPVRTVGGAGLRGSSRPPPVRTVGGAGFYVPGVHGFHVPGVMVSPVGGALVSTFRGSPSVPA
jgi:hypothetical protein